MSGAASCRWKSASGIAAFVQGKNNRYRIQTVYSQFWDGMFQGWWVRFTSGIGDQNTGYWCEPTGAS